MHRSSVEVERCNVTSFASYRLNYFHNGYRVGLSVLVGRVVSMRRDMGGVRGVICPQGKSGGSSGREPRHRRPLASFKVDRRGSWL